MLALDLVELCRGQRILAPVQRVERRRVDRLGRSLDIGDGVVGATGTGGQNGGQEKRDDNTRLKGHEDTAQQLWRPKGHPFE